jgi:hypothetical protein
VGEGNWYVSFPKSSVGRFLNCSSCERGTIGDNLRNGGKPNFIQLGVTRLPFDLHVNAIRFALISHFKEDDKQAPETIVLCKKRAQNSQCQRYRNTS